MRRGFFRWSFSLRTLFITINLIVLVLPIVGIATLRIFENVLHGQTETKLISEGAYVQSLYLAALNDELGGAEFISQITRYVPNAPPPPDGPFRPYFPTIDRTRDKVRPPTMDAKEPKILPHPAAMAAGQHIQPVLMEVQLQNLSGVRVVDVNGVIVASTGGEVGKSVADRYEVSEALKGRYCSVLKERLTDSPPPPLGSISRASRIRVWVAIPIMVDDNHMAGVVYLNRTSISLSRALWDVRYAIAVVILLAVTMAISLLLSHIVTRPFKFMIRQAENIASGERDVPLELGKSAPTEAHQLSHALSSMVDNLKERMEYVEEFTRNVSHEFKTPLAGIQGAIELLNEGWEDMSNDERARFLNIIDTQVRRMDRLVRRLIELTRIENAQPAYASTDLKELLDHLVRRYAENGHSIKLTQNANSAYACIAPDMAETLLVNILDNAVIHGKGAPVSVEVNGGPSVKVRDEGPGISNANLPRIFDRFFTTTRESGGTGLGLAMVKAITDAYGAKIDIKSDKTGTVFTVTFQTVNQD